MSQYKHPYTLIKMSKPKNDFDFFMNDVIKNYNQNAFKLSELLSGITCVRRYSAVIFHKNLMDVLGSRIALNQNELIELDDHINRVFSIDWDIVNLVNDQDECETNEDILNQVALTDQLPSVYVKYLQRLNDNLQLYQFHNRNTPYQVELDLVSTISIGQAHITISMCDTTIDPSQFIYSSEAKKFYRKDVDRKKFEQIATKYPDLNFTIFKLMHRHIYNVLSTRIYPAVDLLELNLAPKKCTALTVMSPSELLGYDEKGDLPALVEEFAKEFKMHKEEMKRAIEVLKREFGLGIVNTLSKQQDNILDKEYLIYELSVK